MFRRKKPVDYEVLRPPPPDETRFPMVIGLVVGLIVVAIVVWMTQPTR